MPGFILTLLINAVGRWLAALFGWSIVSVVSGAASWYIGPRGRYEILVVEKQHR